MERINSAVWMEKYGRWQIKVQKDKIRKTFYSSKPGRAGCAEANRKADAWLRGDIENPSIRVSEMYAKYLESVKQTTSTSNYVKNESIGRCWILPSIGAMKVSRITEAHLQHILDSACSKGLSRKTLTNIRSTIMAFLKYCRKAKTSTLLPEDLTIPRSARYKGKSVLQPEDIRILFTTDTMLYNGKRIKDPLINAYRFQLLTGLRPGELLGLKWADIRGREVSIKRSINSIGEITDGKNANAIRRFTLSDQAYEVLKQQHTDHSGYVFGEVSQNYYLKSWRRYCQSNNINYVTPYELRHTFVSIVKQLPEGDVKTLVGHSRNMDTFGTYGHEISGDSARVAESLSNVFSKIIPD